MAITLTEAKEITEFALDRVRSKAKDWMLVSRVIVRSRERMATAANATRHR